MFLRQPIIANDYFMIITIIGPTINRSDASPKSNLWPNRLIFLIKAIDCSLTRFWARPSGSPHFFLFDEKSLLQKFIAVWRDFEPGSAGACPSRQRSANVSLSVQNIIIFLNFQVRRCDEVCQRRLHCGRFRRERRSWVSPVLLAATSGGRTHWAWVPSTVQLLKVGGEK